jgi:C-terminal processing protease CtpA/Prc
LADEFQELIDSSELAKVNGMIIDLRYSLGGRSDIADVILSSLIDQPVASPIYKYPHYIAAYRSWGREPQWSETNNTIIPRAGNRYLGPLVILTSGVASSTAEDLAISLHYNGRAVLVGGKTAGSTGNPLRISLPGGGSFEVSTFTATYPNGREYAGIGIQPDIKIHLTQEDVYNETDPVLEKALEIIATWK